MGTLISGLESLAPSFLESFRLMLQFCTMVMSGSNPEFGSRGPDLKIRSLILEAEPKFVSMTTETAGFVKTNRTQEWVADRGDWRGQGCKALGVSSAAELLVFKIKCSCTFAGCVQLQKEEHCGMECVFLLAGFDRRFRECGPDDPQCRKPR